MTETLDQPLSEGEFVGAVAHDVEVDPFAVNLLGCGRILSFG